MKHIQLWARRLDLIPTEPPVLSDTNAADYFWTFITEDKKQFKKQLKIKPNGLIMNGNFRYHWARWGSIEFLPIDLEYMLNKSHVGSDQEVIKTPIRSVSRPMCLWAWTHEAGEDYPNTLIQQGHNSDINLSLKWCKEL